MRRGFLRAVINHFAPAAIVTDYLPFGRRRELFWMLSEETQFKKYFIHRGITDTSDGNFLSGASTEAIGKVFDRIVITADKRVFDVLEMDRWDSAARAKSTYVGYVRPESVDRSTVARSCGRRLDAPGLCARRAADGMARN